MDDSLVSEILEKSASLGKPSKLRVLELGCGQSVLGEKLASKGFPVLCTDFSWVCIQQRKSENRNKGVKCV